MRHWIFIIMILSFTSCKKDASVDPENFWGKKIVQIERVEPVQAELLRFTGDERYYNFGPDLEQRLVTVLTNKNRYIVGSEATSESGEGGIIIGNPTRVATRSQVQSGDIQWPARWIPAAKVSLSVESMNFTVGSRGNRMFYGFDDRFRTPFNDGFGHYKNEFPLKLVEFEPNWFDRTFDQKGSQLFGSRAGLELGDGISFDFLVATLKLKYSNYQAELGVKIKIDAPLAGISEEKHVVVHAKGHFLDLSAQYEEYSGGIMIARQDAMFKAFTNAVDGVYESLDRSMKTLPLTGIVDEVLPDGRILLGTGQNSQIKKGVVYQLVEHPEVAIEVTSAEQDGAIGKIIHGDINFIQRDQLIKQVFASAEVLKPTASPIRIQNQSQNRVDLMQSGQALVSSATSSETIELPDKNLEKTNELSKYSESRIAAFLKGLLKLALMPYQIWRNHMYDRPYQKSADRFQEADGKIPDELKINSEEDAKTLEKWKSDYASSEVGKRLGLDQLVWRDGIEPVVAIIDTGMDYNHPVLHGSLWLNPTPATDFAGRLDRYGWDFISGDSRPFDDSYHGTQLASLVLAVEPTAKLMPLKVFNPFGITSSGAIYGAFKYAVDHGAQVILCGWASRQSSHAIELGVHYAHQHGVMVVAAAGDRGDLLDEVPAYPASLAGTYSNVITVASVDDQNLLVHESGLHSNYSSSLVGIAAPGKDIRVAEPRNHYGKVTSTGVAAAFVAGALSNSVRKNPDLAPESAILYLQKRSLTVPQLIDKVFEGKVLRVNP